MIFTEQNIFKFFERYNKDFAVKDDPKVNLEVARYLLSFEIIKKTTNANWIYDYLKNKTKSDKYLFQLDKKRDTIESKKHRTRIFLFAEILYNLQYIPEIQYVFEKFGNDDFESTFIELEFAKYIYRSGRKFRFNKPSGQKGYDYDIYIELNYKEAVGEIKSKLETTVFDPKKTLNTIKSAKKQLPQSQENIIFIKIPEIWGTEESKLQLLATEIKKYIDKSERILTIILLWNIWIIPDDSDFVLLISTQEIRNVNSELENVKFPNNIFTAKVDLGEPDPWIDLMPYINQQLNQRST
jgi:hypothetical protein